MTCKLGCQRSGLCNEPHAQGHEEYKGLQSSSRHYLAGFSVKVENLRFIHPCLRATEPVRRKWKPFPCRMQTHAEFHDCVPAAGHLSEFVDGAHDSHAEGPRERRNIGWTDFAMGTFGSLIGNFVAGFISSHGLARQRFSHGLPLASRCCPSSTLSYLSASPETGRATQLSVTMSLRNRRLSKRDGKLRRQSTGELLSSPSSSAVCLRITGRSGVSNSGTCCRRLAASNRWCCRSRANARFRRVYLRVNPSAEFD